MTTMNDLFIEYLKRIQPTPKAVERASKSHNPLREDLEKDEEFGSYVETTMLSGSYGRDTAIFGIKDVDVIIKTKFTLGDLWKKKEDNETLQECLLRLTQEAIKRTGRTIKKHGARTRRRSILVRLPQNDDEDLPELTMDIVPVLVQSEASKDPMTISDRELSQWFDTYPNTQLTDSEKRNQASSYLVDRRHYKPLVKIFKAWKQANFRSYKTPKGFVLECMTANFHNPLAESWVDAVLDLFQNICDEWPNPDTLGYVPEVPDISDSSPNMVRIAKADDVEGAKRVLKKIHAHLELIKQAQEEAEEDLEKAAKTLQRVFGSDCDVVCFPLPGDLEENSGQSGTRKSASNVTETPPFA
jgi:hypothetical protein